MISRGRGILSCSTLFLSPQSLENKLKDITVSEAKLHDINAELNTKMTEMVDDFDRDKKAALDR